MLAEFGRVAQSLPIKQEFVPFKQWKVTFKDIKVRKNAWYFLQNVKKKVLILMYKVKEGDGLKS